MVSGARRPIRVALVGNPNTGKTSLMNTLLGMHLHVGNWPGKTVEKHSGILEMAGRVFELVDLPGIYALDAYSEEESITRGFLEEGVDIVVQVVDVNALERNLLLALQVLALGGSRHMILAFNFNAEARRRGAYIESESLARILELPVVEIEAHTGKNKEGLLQALVKAPADPPKPTYLDSLLGEDGRVSHQKALNFIREEVLPYYRAPAPGRLQARMDALFFNRWLALPMIFGAMFLVFETTFLIAHPVVVLIARCFERLRDYTLSLGLPHVLQSFVEEGLINGLGTVLSFTPLIFTMFTFIAILEDCGLLARMVVGVDRFFQWCGLSGRVFVPMILGFGCNVPAILATRTIHSRRERMIAMALNPLMSCSARLPVYLLFAPVFFHHSWALVIVGLYAFGVGLAFVGARVLCRFIPEDECPDLILELPPYRRPLVINVLNTALHQTMQFLRKAGSFIFGVIVLIWALANLPPDAAYGSSESVVGIIGRHVAPVLAPLGFGHWIFAVALIFGFAAKEVIIGALGTICGATGVALGEILPQYLSPAGAVSLMLFVLLYTPCLGTLATLRQESGSWRFVALQAVLYLVLAWLISFIFFQTVRFFALA